MTPLDIEVTAEDIREGRRNNCMACPIALAIQRAAETSDAWVGLSRARIGDEHYFLPPSARAFIVAFDCQQSVAPFTFRLE